MSVIVWSVSVEKAVSVLYCFVANDERGGDYCCYFSLPIIKFYYNIGR